MALNPYFEVLDKARHQLKSFDCGKAVMNDFLKRYAVKNQNLGLSRTWVLAENSADGEKAAVAAYYTLAFQSVEPENFRDKVSLPRYPTPTILLARLAVNKAYQGQRLGRKTLLAALAQAARISEQGLPAYALVLDVLDDDAHRFYQQFDFFKSFDTPADDRVRLFVPMSAVKHLLAGY
ncbi:GNAT family N-acetyltransferase [Paralysiella testudinis]|uniref:GNAT family N-acetyltransferase n=1 Tax=Paralysiella testudinis TaxID=2809020 RepID=A0A892ZKC3_9NEIS|nr:GNAT family N-acetyltransferase [Paralysiella testudinis]QRQ82868.1 GNAT family N-acetyltransferase [Paralysiella testudinis]